MKFYSLIGLISVIVTLASCVQKTNTAKENKIDFNPQKEILSSLSFSQNTSVNKVIALNNKYDTLKKVQVNWLQEMDFLDLINTEKAAYKGNLFQYSEKKADTIYQFLSCNDPNLNFQKAEAAYYNQKLIHLTAWCNTNNFLYQNKKKIYFNPEKGYLITGHQSIKLFSKNSLEYLVLVQKDL